jgi:hypothetical protein
MSRAPPTTAARSRMPRTPIILVEAVEGSNPTPSTSVVNAATTAISAARSRGILLTLTPQPFAQGVTMPSDERSGLLALRRGE